MEIKPNISLNHRNSGELLIISGEYLICLNALNTSRQNSSQLKPNYSLVIRFVLDDQCSVMYYGKIFKVDLFPYSPERADEVHRSSASNRRD